MANNKKKKKGKRKTKAEIAAQEELKAWITTVLMIALTIVAYCEWGVIGVYLSRSLRFVFGQFYYFIVAVAVIQGIVYIINNKTGLDSKKNPIALILIMIIICIACSYSVYAKNGEHLKGFAIFEDFTLGWKEYFAKSTTRPVGGGIIGALFLSLTTYLVDYTGSVLLMVVMGIIAALLLVNLEVYKNAFAWIRAYFAPAPKEEQQEVVDSHYEETYVEEKTATPYVEPIKEEVVEKEEVKPTLKRIDVDMEEEEDLVESYPTPSEIIDSKFGITADDDVDIEDDILDMLQNKNVDIVKEEIPTPAKEEEKTSIFMDVDDLIDKHAVEDIVEIVSENPQIVESVMDESIVQQPVPPRYQATNVRPFETPVQQTSVSNQAPVPPVAIPACPIKHEAVSEGLPDETAIVPNDIEQPETPQGNKPLKPYVLPGMDLLDPIPAPPKVDQNAVAAKEKGELLIQALRNFDIEARLLDVHIGPSVTKFEIRPEASVKVSKILNLTDDLKMQLAVKDIRIEAPIPGHNAVGVEIPNVEAVPVKMRDLIGHVKDKDKNQPLLIVLGKDLLGQTITCRLDKMPHLLIAGATGSGKSVCMNSIITSILMRTKPEEVKLLLVDPKKVEFTPYRKIPHLIGPVINDPNQANNALKVIVKIMDERYDVFAKTGVRNIQSYNQKCKNDTDENPLKPMPYIVVIIDELADLMAVAGKDVEASIQRITQLARAAGIHLIVATQRPSTDVITGIIKANIPSRIAFAVSSGIDSRTILDHTGAERLLGYGDMLYLPIGASGAIRVQGVFVTDDEVYRISEFCSKQRIPMYDDAFVRLEGVDGNDGTSIMGVDVDPLYDEVLHYVVDVEKCSTSLLQRRFSIGYNRAARMVDMLQEQGVIGPAQGSKPREVFLTKEDLENEGEQDPLF